MKQEIQNLISNSLSSLSSQNLVEELGNDFSITIEYSRDPEHGDFASNIAMVLAKRVGRNPRELAELIIHNLAESDFIKKAEIAGPGFINFFLADNAYQNVVLDILDKRTAYGESNDGNGNTVMIEFVSANPTGPLHIGHGRGAAYGAAVSSLLRKTGYKVCCEYYVNDAGRQMDILTVSVWIRYLQKIVPDIPFPENGYKGDYINSISEALFNKYDEQFKTDKDELLHIFDESDPEKQIDQLIRCCKEIVGDENYQLIFNAGLDEILESIRSDLQNFGVEFDNWFSERSLFKDQLISDCINKLSNKDWVYEKDGATWFRSTELGDEKDRVLVRDNGQTTYFASDIAYHLSKLNRGYDKLIDIWGADHHGYIARVKASMQALELESEKLEILLVQFATLYRGKEKLQMSTRSGEFITLKELQDEVGKDAARFFYIMRKSEQHLDFDLELAKSQSSDNPVYYIQYAHARICSVFRQMEEKGYTYNSNVKLSDLTELTEPHELKLLKTLSRFPEMVKNAADSYEPHQLAYYLKDLANDFHTYYNSNQFLVEEDSIRSARLALIDASRQVIFNGLSILGVNSPEEM